MAKQIKVVNTVTGTGSTTDITSTGIGTPDGVLVFLNGVTADDTDTSDILMARAAWDGTTLHGACGYMEDGVASSNTGSMQTNDLRLMSTANTALAIGTISSTTDGITITWSTSPSASYKITVVFFAGGLDVDVGRSSMPGNLGTTAYTGAGFEPDAVFCLGSWYLGGGVFPQTAIGSDNNMSLGWAVNDGSETQFCQGFHSNDARNSAEVKQRNYSNRFADNGAGYKMWSLKTFDANGFTIEELDSNLATNIYGIFLSIGGLANVASSTSLDLSTTGSKSITGTGFEPDFAFLVQQRATIFDSNYTNLDNETKFGVTDGTTDAGLSQYEDDANTNPIAKNRVSASNIIDAASADVEAIKATFTSFDSGGLTVNCTGAGTSTGATLMLQADAGGAPPGVDDSVPWMSFF